MSRRKALKEKLSTKKTTFHKKRGRAHPKFASNSRMNPAPVSYQFDQKQTDYLISQFSKIDNQPTFGQTRYMAKQLKVDGTFIERWFTDRASKLEEDKQIASERPIRYFDVPTDSEAFLPPSLQDYPSMDDTHISIELNNAEDDIAWE